MQLCVSEMEHGPNVDSQYRTKPQSSLNHNRSNESARRITEECNFTKSVWSNVIQQTDLGSGSNQVSAETHDTATEAKPLKTNQ